MIRRIISIASGGYCIEARNLFALMTTNPGVARKRLIDRTIRSLKNEGLWEKIISLYVPAAHDSQAARLDWKRLAGNTLTVSGSPAFTQDRGYKGDGTGYLEGPAVMTSLNPDQFSWHFGAFFDQVDTTSANNMFSPDGGGSLAIGAQSNQVAVSSGQPLDRQSFSATASSVITTRFDDDGSGFPVFADGVLVGTGVDDLSLSWANSPLRLLRATSGGASQARVNIAVFGRYLTNDEAVALHGILDAYMAGL